MDDVALGSQKEAFSLPPHLHYLNCAYMSPLPRAVEEAGLEGMRKKRDPSRISPEDFFLESQEVREHFARLVKAPEPASVALLPSVSYGVSVAVRNTPLDRGQNVILLEEQFPGNVYGWMRAAKEAGARIRMVGPGGKGGERGGQGLSGPGARDEGTGRGRRWNERILEAIDSRTAAVALGPVHWTDGTVFDLEAIGSRAREVGAALVVDGTQAVGALPFDVERIRPDALIVASYKWLFGPYSVGMGYFGNRYRGGVPLEETWIAREGSEDFRGLVDYRDEYQPGAVRFDVGERSNFILVPMVLAALRLVLKWRPERIQAYARSLTEGLLEEAQDLGYTVEEPAFRAGHIFGLRLGKGMAMERLNQALREEQVSASLRGSALRVSPNVYNDEEDVAALARALRSGVG